MTIEDMIAELSGRYPGFFRDAEGVDANIATYRRTLGHLTPEQLEAAFTETMKTYEDKFAPPLPKDILANVRTSWQSGGTFNMKAMCDALPGLEKDIRASWNARRKAVGKQLVAAFREANPGHEAAAEDEIRGLLKETLRAKIHVHAQKVFQNKARVDDFELTDDELPYHGKARKLDDYTIAVREGREPPKIRRIG